MNKCLKKNSENVGSLVSCNGAVSLLLSKGAARGRGQNQEGLDLQQLKAGGLFQTHTEASSSVA